MSREGKEEEGPERNEEQAKEVLSHVQRLIDLASECTFFYDEQREAYAVAHINDHQETLRIKGSDFRLWMVRMFYESYGGSPSSDAITRALQTLEAQARYDGDCHPLHYRVASDKERFYYDLADSAWRVVEVGSSHWKIAKHPFKFKRAGNTAPQVEPQSGGCLDKVLQYVNLVNPRDRVLLQVFLVACLVPDIPHPLLLLMGEKGAAKSTLARIIKKLVDPADEELLSLSQGQNELGLLLAKNYVASFDNLDGMQNWQSDLLAKAVTGGGMTKRKLFTDDEEIILKFKRVIVLNGINPAVTRSDLLDRTIPLMLERIPKEKRKEEGEFWREFEKDRPYIFGAMLDVLVEAKQIYPHVKLTELPRMADFCRWGWAIAEAMGIGGKTFLAMYWEAIEHQNEVAIDHHPIAFAIRVFMEGKPDWEGSPSGLLDELEMTADSEKIDKKARSWPKAAQSLTKRLKEIKSNLADIGITFLETRTGASRFIVLRNANASSQASSVALSLFDNGNSAAAKSVSDSLEVVRNHDDGSDANDASLDIGGAEEGENDE